MHKRHPGHLLIGGGLSLLLAACSQSSPPTASSADPYAGGASYPWSYTAPANKLTTLSLTPGVNTLYYEPLLAARNGWGSIEIDHSNGEQAAGDGKTITLDGKTYARGFGTHAGSEMRYSLQGSGGASCTTFTADVGVDDEVGNRGSVVFQIYLDGVKKYDSGTLTGASATKKVSVDITGARELRMIATDAGDGINYDHADWANPKIVCVATSTPASGSLDPGFGQGGIANVGGADAVLEPDNSVLIADSANGNFVLKRLRPDGTVQQVMTDFGYQDAAYALARQPDGKIVVAGSSGDNFAAARYNTNLTLDTGFGLGGKAITSVGSLGGSVAYAVALQPDGKIVAAGTALHTLAADSEGHSQDVAAVRYTASGVLDTTFGTGGIAFVGFDPESSTGVSNDEASAVVIQPDGKIAIAGVSMLQPGVPFGLLTRLTAGGALDQTFGSGGAAFGDLYSIYNDVAQEADGNLVAVGYQGRNYGEGVVRRYGPNGSPLGETIVTFSPGNHYDRNSLARLLAQPDGKLLISGETQTVSVTQGSEAGPVQTVLARLNPNLSLDTSFGTGGKAVVPIPVSYGLSPAITPLRQSDGKIVVVGKQTARLFP